MLRAQFHNAMHAADVVQAVYSMLHAVHLLPKLTELEIFSVLLAAAAHGVSHSCCICCSHVAVGTVTVHDLRF